MDKNTCQVCNSMFQMIRVALTFYFIWFFVVLILKTPTPNEVIAYLTELLKKMDVKLPSLE